MATWVSGFAKSHPTLLKVAAAIGLVAAVLGPLLIVLGLIIPILMGPVGIAIAIGAVVAGIATFIASNKTAKGIISTIWTGIQTAVTSAISVVLKGFANMAKTASKIGILPDAVQRKMAALSKSLEEGSKRVLDFGKKTKETKEEVIPATKATDRFADAFTTPRIGLNPAMEEAAKKAETLKKKHDALRESFEDTINPSEKLGEKLGILIDEFDRWDVVHAHWQEILSARDASEQYGTVLDPLIASMLEQAEAFKTLNAVAQGHIDKLIKLDAVVLPPLNKSYDGLILNTGPDGLQGALDGVNDSVDDHIEGIGELDHVVEESTAAKNFASQWNTAMGNLTADVSKSITDIWSGGGSPLSKLGKAFVEFGKGALSAITTTLLTPLLNAFTDLAASLGKRLLDSLMGVFGIGGGGGGGGGGIVDRIFGGGGGGGAGAGAGAAAGGGGMGSGLDIIFQGIEAFGSIAQLFKANKQVAIEQNTRYTAIDIHGVRHGLATGEFFMQDWTIIAWLQHINETLVATLWPIRFALVDVIPPKMDAMHTENVEIQRSMLSELKEIKSNTSNLQGIVGAIKESAQASSSSRSGVEDLIEDAIRLGKGNIREVISEVVKSEG